MANERPLFDPGLSAPVEDQRHVPVVAGQGSVLQTDEVAGVRPLARVEGDIANLAPGPGQSGHSDDGARPMRGQLRPMRGRHDITVTLTCPAQV